MAKKRSKRRRRRVSAFSPLANHSRTANRPKSSRSLHFEGLEPRHLLTTLTVDALGDISNAGDGLTTLREAVVVANNTAGADTIVFASGLSGAEIDLTQGELDITDTLTIDASPLAANIVIDAQQISRAIRFRVLPGNVNLNGNLTLNALDIKNGSTAGHGGAVYFGTGGTLTITNSTISGSSSARYGGGLYTFSGAVTMTGSSVTGNTAQGFGGGIFADSGALTLNNSTVSGNMSDTFGGGISSQHGPITLLNSTVSGNDAQSSGGGIAIGGVGAVTLINSSLTNNESGSSGGGISSVTSPVILIGSTVSDNIADNRGGGILSQGGDVTLTSSTVSGNSGKNGAGIFTLTAAVTLSSSTVSGNSSTYDAGGIFADTGSVTLTDSTVSGNSSTGYGGGIGTNSATIIVTGSTLSGNSSQTAGGIFTDTGAVTINNSTVTENTANVVGGVVITNGPQNPPLTIQNSIIAGNISSTRPIDLTFDPDGVIDINYSLIGETLGVLLPEAQTPDANGNLVGNFLGGGIIDPLLGPLADNGGLTETHAPLLGSPAINAGDPLVALNFSELDQRGFLRVIDGRVDMGAVESPLSSPEASLVVTIAADLENPFDGFTSLRDAINFANSLPGAATITFDAALSGAEIDLTEGELLISDTVTIDAGSLAENVTIDAQQQSRVINFNAAGFDLTLVGLNVQNGLVDGAGGGILFADSGTLSLTRSSVNGNSTSGANADGGGIFMFTGTLVMRDSTVSGNSTDGNVARGGGIFTQQGTVRVANSTISGNTTLGANADGGGIYMGSGTLRINNSTVTDNTAAGAGAIYFGNRAYLDNSIVAGNSGAGVPSNIAGSGPILGGNYNLLGDGLAPGTSTNITGVNNPLLGPLADNGGQSQTHALLPSGLAINAGDPSFNPNNFLPPLVNDQRGMPRIGNGLLDIGAFESPNAPPQTPTDVDANGNVVGEGAAGGATVGITANAVDPGDSVTYSLTDDAGGRFQIDPGTGVVTVLDSSTLDGPESYTITVEAEDQGSATSTADFTINVLNVDPSLSPLTVTQSTVTEGNLTTVQGSFTDGALGVASETFTGTATWSDGETTPVIINTDGTFSSTRTFDDDNPTGTSSDEVTATITISDDDGGSDTAVSPTVTVQNSAPVIGSLSLTQSAVQESFSTTVNGSFTDQALGVATETFSATATWSDGVQRFVQLNANGTFSTSRLFDDDNPTGTPSDDFTVSITISDDDGGSDTAVSPTVTVLNTAPVMSTLSVTQSTVVESFSTTVTGSFTDAALGVVTETFTGTAIWSDGVPTFLQINPDGTFSTSRFFNDDNPSGTPSDDYTVTITITDDDGGSGSAVSPVVTVLNAAPTIDSLVALESDSNVSISGTFSDLGIFDTHTISVAWGDGTPLESINLNQVAGTFDGQHTYSVVGDYTINVAINDDDGGSAGQSIMVTATSADFNTDGDVDGGDFLAWQRGFGKPNATTTDGDADGDLDVDATDLGVWTSQFGQTAAPIAAAASFVTDSPQPIAASTAQSSQADLIDAAMALDSASGVQAVAAAPLLVEQTFSEPVSDKVFALSELLPKSYLDLGSDAPASSTEDSEETEADDSWLSEELLELVFG